MVNIVFNFNQRYFLNFADGYSWIDYYKSLWNITLEDQLMSNEFYFCNLWFALLYWYGDYFPKSTFVINKIKERNENVFVSYRAED